MGMLDCWRIFRFGSFNFGFGFWGTLFRGRTLALLLGESVLRVSSVGDGGLGMARSTLMCSIVGFLL